MATKMDARDVKELREKIRKAEVEWAALPKWTQAFVVKGELLLALKKQLSAAEPDPEDISKVPPKLEYVRGDPQSELAAIDKRLNLIGDGPLENEVYIAHRSRLLARKEQINERLPYADLSDDDLIRQLEDAEVAAEQLANRQANLRRIRPNDPLNSKEALQVARLANEAGEGVARLKHEQKQRIEHRSMQVGVETGAQQQAKELATEAWRKGLETTMAEMQANGAPAWDIQRVREESGGSAPAEMVEQVAADIKAEWWDKHPSTDPSVSI